MQSHTPFTRTFTTACLLSLSAALTAGSANAATLLAGFYDSDTDAVVAGLAANETAAGITATFDGRGRGFNTWGSGDGTYGTFAGASSDTQSAEAYRASANFGGATFNITNGTGVDVSIETIAFDYHNNDDSSRDYWDNLAVTYVSGDLGIADGTTIQSWAGLARDNTTNGINAKGGDYLDYDTSLLGLADFTLADGETAIFRIISTSTDTPLGNARNFAPVDNIGFFGTVSSTAIPEPASLAVGLFGLGALALRRRRRD